MDQDEYIKADSTAEQLAKLKPAFKKAGSGVVQMDCPSAHRARTARSQQAGAPLKGQTARGTDSLVSTLNSSPVSRQCIWPQRRGGVVLANVFVQGREVGVASKLLKLETPDSVSVGLWQAHELGLEPLVCIRGFASAGVDPKIMGASAGD